MFTKPTPPATSQLIRYVSSKIPSSQGILQTTAATIKTVALCVFSSILAIAAHDYLASLLSSGIKNDTMVEQRSPAWCNVTNMTGSSDSSYKGQNHLLTYVGVFTGGMITTFIPFYGFLKLSNIDWRDVF